MLKLIYIIIDGMGDVPVEELGGRTPLEAAETPYMDSLARNGKTGLMYTVGKGIAPESDVAVVSILGYDPFRYHVSRGALESVGAGLNMSDGDLALRCNFGTLAADGSSIVDRRAGRDLTQEEADVLAEAVNGQVRLVSYPASLQIKSTATYRAALVIRSEGKSRLSGNVSNTDPAYKRINSVGVADLEAEMVLKSCVPLDKTEEAKVSAELVNEFTRRAMGVLDGHEVNRRRAEEGKLRANVLLSRDAGSVVPRFPSLSELYGLSFVCLADMNVERGISRLVGMRLVDLPLPSESLERDCELRVKKLFEVLPSYDCFYIHIKGPDVPGHDGDFDLKTRLIAVIDKYFVGEMLRQIDLEDHVICITADHVTPCKLKAHSDDPVPLLIAGGRLQGDGVQRFSEKECGMGELGVLSMGTELMPRLVSYVKG
ncbi:MAG TPA: 2,3-bisphosphoglycerate-independent phosphoglycerate mutase [Candidatus Bathyarchaeota archaeon]|nr:2,3-bisphosphoglycerate-independent phosphoglycerate mutase [Candidatus Bathyarchaeota archaeon]